MFGKGDSTTYAVGVTRLYFDNSIGYFMIAVIGCMPRMRRLIEAADKGTKAANVILQFGTIAVFIIACCITIDSNYNPFIYFNV